MILKITKNTDPIWKQKFKNVKKITPEIKKLVSDMMETVGITSAVGLAAPQVGVALRLFVISYGRLKEAFINPKIVHRGKETNEIEEGCLSVPCVRGSVNRVNEIEIDYQDLKGRTKKATLSGYYARITQHEYDHLSSSFYTDRILDSNKLYTYKTIKIVFFGTPTFGAVILKSLIGQKLVGEYNIPLVVTAPDKPAGRGQEPKSSPVKDLAVQFNIPTETPTTLKNNVALVNKLKSIEPDFIVLASYGKIVPKEILEIPRRAAINIHPSLLPRYRGVSPIQAALLNGDKYTGVTIMKMNEKLDEGAVLGAARLTIKKTDTSESLSERLASLSASLTRHVLHIMTVGDIKPKPQSPTGASYSKILTKEDGLIDWKKPPENLERMIRAYYPWPGVWSKLKIKNEELRIKLLPNKMIQLEGKEPVKLEDFKRGHPEFNLVW
jgi:methionyl-tRNA formyltransferase